jgi:hypothetical protein
MENIESVQQLKLNFLEIWKQISNEDTQALMSLENTNSIALRVEPFCTTIFPLQKVLLTFHAYALIAYLSAEIIVNAKIFLDNNKQKYILLGRKQTQQGLQFCIVYSNIKYLSQHPGHGICVDNMIAFLESNDAIKNLQEYYQNSISS